MESGMCFGHRCARKALQGVVVALLNSYRLIALVALALSRWCASPPRSESIKLSSCGVRVPVVLIIVATTTDDLIYQTRFHIYGETRMLIMQE